MDYAPLMLLQSVLLIRDMVVASKAVECSTSSTNSHHSQENSKEHQKVVFNGTHRLFVG